MVFLNNLKQAHAAICGWPNYWFSVLLFVHLRVADCSDQPIIFCFAVAYYISFSLFRVTTLTAVIN
jgi:hypothetical protein